MLSYQCAIGVLSLCYRHTAMIVHCRREITNNYTFTFTLVFIFLYYSFIRKPLNVKRNKEVRPGLTRAYGAFLWKRNRSRVQQLFGLVAYYLGKRSLQPHLKFRCCFLIAFNSASIQFIISYNSYQFHIYSTILTITCART